MYASRATMGAICGKLGSEMQTCPFAEGDPAQPAVVIAWQPVRCVVVRR